MKITIELPEGYAYATKIDGREVLWHPGKMDNSYLVAFLEKGMQRLANDKWSGEKGDTKYDLVKGMAQDANSGKELPEGRTRTARLPDDIALAQKNAKADLLLVFKKATGKGKVADMQDVPQIAAFFQEKGGSTVWNPDAVNRYIEKQRVDGGRDYIAEARATLGGEEDAEELLGALL